MTAIIPLFLEDPFSGLQRPNRSVPTQYVIVDLADGSGVSIHEDRNQAINAMAQLGEPGRYFIETWPGYGLQGVEYV